MVQQVVKTMFRYVEGRLYNKILSNVAFLFIYLFFFSVLALSIQFFNEY